MRRHVLSCKAVADGVDELPARQRLIRDKTRRQVHVDARVESEGTIIMSP